MERKVSGAEALRRAKTLANLAPSMCWSFCSNVCSIGSWEMNLGTTAGADELLEEAPVSGVFFAWALLHL